MAVKTKKKAGSKNSDAIKSRKCLTPVFRVSFPQLVEPQAVQEGAQKKYSVQALWPKSTDLNIAASKKDGALSLKRIIRNAIVEAYGEDKKNWPKNLKSPLRDGAEKEDLEGYKDTMFASLSNKKRVPVIDYPNGTPIENVEDEIYPGCYARATVIAAAYDQAGNKGVTLVLMSLQKVRDGERLGGSFDVSEDYSDEELDDEDTETESEEENDDDLGL